MTTLIAKTLKPIVGAAALAAIAVFLPTPAHAFNVTLGGNPVSGQGVFSTVSSTTTVDFNSVTAPREVSDANPFTSGLATYTGSNETVVGRIVRGYEYNRYATLPGNRSNYLSLGSSQERGPVEISFAKVMDYFGLNWGSIDGYNSIAFFRDGNLIRSYSGTDVLASADGNQSEQGARYVNFFAEDSSQWFNSIVLTSGRAAFESDNHAYRVVPTPALIPAALGFGAAMLRRRKKTEEDAAEGNA